jgi:SAM-dependent methyltransferase
MRKFSNRLVTRDEAERLSSDERAELEARVTDELGANICVPVIRPERAFQEYSHRNPWRKQMFDFLGPLAGKTVLDLGCGYNPTPIYLALAGAERVIAVDVSPKAIEFVTNLARASGLEDRIVPVLAPVARLPLDDESVDLIHGEAVLHHLKIDVAGQQLSRILKPGGRAAFKDPMGHNFLLEFARDYLPYRWKHSVKGTDRPLKFSEARQFGSYFSRCETQGFGFLSLFATAFFGRKRTAIHSLMHRFDALLLRFIPGLQYCCRFIVTCVEK